MADTLTTSERSRRMAAIRGKNTKPELIVRRLLHSRGFRFRLHHTGLPGHPDLVFPSRRAVIFVHGCFWHRHPDPACPLARLPKSRLDFWLPKLESNARRDRAVAERLARDGWRSLTVWECELVHLDEVEVKMLAFLNGPPWETQPC